ncbi:type II toxin-antitoxin system prevent-host-death family antitoxin [Streptomyces sp. NPDC051104]|uniref:type II toxin-antitoxin system prevent-host-death family antitoxin n=1 Tax=Streptomyces sp. NPDC051104 TaxID=3155044 RepID=UPI00341BE22C
MTPQEAEATQTPERTAVYRLFDEDEALLYVGVAQDPRVRFRQHRREKPWWPQVAVREVEWHDSREQALKAEADTIARELPRHNDVGVPWPHHRLGEAPARVVNFSTFKACLRLLVDEVADTGAPLAITHQGAPRVIVVPYFDRLQAEPEK